MCIDIHTYIYAYIHLYSGLAESKDKSKDTEQKVDASGSLKHVVETSTTTNNMGTYSQNRYIFQAPKYT